MTPKLGVEAAALIDGNVRLVPDFPSEGVLFRDITPLFANGKDFARLIQLLGERYSGKVDMVAGLESRGFILAAPLAAELGIGMIAVRKAGKLPGPVIGVDYSLEYGKARLEVQPEGVPKGSEVLVLDDVLATGGTARACVDLIEQCGASVFEVAVLMELIDLGGAQRLKNVPLVTGVQVKEDQ